VEEVLMRHHSPTDRGCLGVAFPTAIRRSARSSAGRVTTETGEALSDLL
jgi:hypothetical protein